jgi:prevent-host-death family protein
MAVLAKNKGYEEIDVTDARKKFADLLSKVGFAGDRVVLCRNGKKIAAILPVEDLELLKKFEDERDLRETKAALKGRLYTSKEVKKKLGIA